MNSDNDNLVSIILGMAAVALLVEGISKAIGLVEKFYQIHRAAILTVAIVLLGIVVLAVSIKLYFRFSQKQAEARKFIALQAENTRQLIEAKRTEAMLQRKLDLAPETKPIEIPKPKKLSLAARAAKEE